MLELEDGKFSQGQAIAVYYDNNFYLGEVLQSHEDDTAEVSFMDQVPNKNIFQWKHEDTDVKSWLGCIHCSKRSTASDVSKTVCHSVDRFLIWISIGEIFAKHGGFWRYLFCFVFYHFFHKIEISWKS